MDLKRNFRSILTWTVASQVVALAALPVLTRLYPPDAYGVLAVYASAVAMLMAVATIRLEWHIPNCKNAATAGALAAGAVVIAIILIVGVCIVAAVVGPEPLRQYGMILVAAVGVGAIVQAVENVGSAFRVWNGDVTRLGRARFIRQSTTAIAAIGLFGILPDHRGLVAATVIAGIGACAYIGVGSGFRRALVAARASMGRVPRIIRAVWRRASVSVLVSANNTFSYEIVPVMLIAFFSAEAAGLYFLSRRLLAQPFSLVSTSLASSFWAYAAVTFRNDPAELYRKYQKLTLRLALISIPCVVFIVLVAQVLPFILGDDWAAISEVLVATVPMAVGTLVFSGVGHLIVLKRHHYQLIADGTRLALMVAGVLFASIHSLDLVTTVWLLSSSSLFGHLLFYAAHLMAYRDHGIGVRT